MKKVIIYGTFDLLHYGHMRKLKMAKEMGDYLIVGLSTEKYDKEKGKKSYYDYKIRKEMLENLKVVDLVIPEKSLHQRLKDIQKYQIDIMVAEPKPIEIEVCDKLSDHCQIIFMDRIPGISTSQIKKETKIMD